MEPTSTKSERARKCVASSAVLMNRMLWNRLQAGAEGRPTKLFIIYRWAEGPCMTAN